MVTEPTRDDLAKALFLSARKHRAVMELRGWDRREFKDGDWNCVSPALPDADKERWRNVADDILSCWELKA